MSTEEPYTNDYSWYILDPRRLPKSGADLYSIEQKKEATEDAEQKLEADVNGGERIEKPTSLHATAAAFLATNILAEGPIHPDDTNAGSQGDDGSARQEFAQRMEDKYWTWVDSIQVSETDDPRPDEDLTGSGDDGPSRADTGGRTHVTHRGRHDPDEIDAWGGDTVRRGQ